ncbi:MAG TPA: imidazolonepropionase [Bacteroidetes bacterium]|nr:imidazolonepropionase [Bacteroidota bacterium]
MEEKQVLFRHIKQLFPVLDEGISRVEGENMQELQVMENAWLEIKNGVIHDFGSMKDCPGPPAGTKVVEAHGRLLMPAFCDSHTHIVYAGSREKEYVDKIRGLSYGEIARRGGGILNSALLLQQTSEDELFEQSMIRVHEIMSLGTGSVEIKSGYGLTLEAELKMLRVIRRIRESVPMNVKSTFLGAHSIPMEYRSDPDRYVDLVVKEMIPAVGRENLADHIDVFCDRGFFTPGQTARILEAGARYGMVPKIHANELDYSGGIQTGVKFGAFSVDHLEYTGEEEIQALLKSRTMPTLLPGASFFLGMPYAPARKMIDAGLPVALASDYNPGSSPSGNMKLIMSLGCIQMKMLPEEAIYAVTINGAGAMGVEKETGSITRGKKANLILTVPVPGYEFLPYAYGSNLVESVWLNGNLI